MTVFYLVRHGVTEHTGHKLSGLMAGLDLTAEGLKQAELVAGHLAETPLKAIYSSPLERCRQTAEVVARRHRGLTVRALPALGEVDYGSWTGRSLRTVARTKLWTSVQRWPSRVRFPEGEAIREVQARAVNAIEEIAARHPKQHVCCATHSDVIRVLVTHYVGSHLDMYDRIVTAPGSVTVIALGTGAPPRVVALNVVPQEPPV